MEEGTPILETFTQSVSEGPSHSLMRKLMSMMLSADAPREDPDISGFFLVDDTDTAPALSGGESSRAVAEDIAEASSSVGCPVEDMETVVQSGFRFAGVEGFCESPRAENYFTESPSIIPTDVAEKLPVEFLHAVNNALDTKVIPTAKTHHHGRRRGGRRLGVFRNREEHPAAPSSSSSSSAFGASYGQEMILRRLDRLEEICLRTESYMHLVLGTMDRRLQLLEGEALRSTRDSACSPRFPGSAAAAGDGFKNESGTLLNPEMLTLQSPCRERTLFSKSLLQIPDEKPGGGEPAICLSPIDSLSSPALILASSFISAAGSSTSGEAPLAEHPFTTPAAEELQQQQQQQEVEASPVLATLQAGEDGELQQQTQVSAIAEFSLAEAPSQQDPLFCEPVVTWENDGFPYLRPSYRVPGGARLRETTVLTWDAVGHLSPESASSDDDRRTSNSSDDAFSFYNLERFSLPPSPPLPHQHHEELRRQEEGMLEEVSGILKNICSDLELLRAGPESQRQSQPQQQQRRPLPESCQYCSRRNPEMVLSCREEEEIFSVLENVFQRLAFLPEPEDVLVNIIPGDDAPAPAPAPAAQAPTPAAEAVHYSRVPESEEAASSTRIERSFEIFPQEAGSQKISLSFVQEEKPELSSATQDTRVKIGVPKDAGSNELATLHVAVAPKEVKLDASSEQIASSIVQDVCVSVESSCPGPLVLEKYSGPEKNPPRELGSAGEAVKVAEEKVQLTGEISADYTLKVVPQEGASVSEVVFPEASPDEKMIDNDAVSKVVHELCFSVDVPTSGAGMEAEAPQPKLPLQVAIALTGNSKAGCGAEVVSAQGINVRPLIKDTPVQEAGEGESEQRKEVASIILSLEPLEKAGEVSCSRPGCSRTEPCGDPNCLLASDRKEVGREEVTSIHQDVCISLEVPAAETIGGEEKIEVGVSVKSVPTLVQGDDVEQLISCVELSEDQEPGKAPLTEIPSSVARVEQPPSDEEEDPEELLPLKPKVAVEPVGILVEASESLVAPPPSPVEAEAAPETDEYLFKEETKKAPESETPAETHEYLFKEEEETTKKAQESEAPAEYLFKEEDDTATRLPESEAPTETHEYLFKEAEEAEAKKPVESVAAETHEYLLFKEEPKKPGEEWLIDSVLFPKESLQQVEARVPQPVFRGMTPMDLVRGSLHFDGKACLLAVSMDDLWTADEMCQAPSSAAALAKQKYLFKPIDISGRKAGAGASAGAGSSIRDVPSWLGEVLGDGTKPPAGEKITTGFTPVFGFQRQRVDPEQNQKQQQEQAQQIQQQNPMFGFRPPVGITPVFGFRNLSGKQPVKAAAQQQPAEPIFGFVSSANPNAGKPPLPPKSRIFVNVPVAAEEELDSSLSLVSRSPACHSRSKLPRDEQPPPTRAPDSPGSKNSIATAAATTATTTTTNSSLVVVEIDPEQVTCKVEAGAGAIETAEVEVNGAGGGDEGAGTGEVVRAQNSPLDLIDAGGVSEGESGEWSSELTVLPLDPSAVAAAAAAVSQDEAFFDALQCSGKHSGNNKLKKYLKDKVWDKFACYGVGMPDSDSSESISCQHNRA